MMTTRDASASYVSGLRAAAPAPAAPLPPLAPQKRMRIGAVLPQEPVESVIDAQITADQATPRVETPHDFAALLPQLAQASNNMSPQLASALLACYLTIQQSQPGTPSPYTMSSVTPSEGISVSKPATPVNDEGLIDRHPRSPSHPPPPIAQLGDGLISSAMPSLLRRGSSGTPTNTDVTAMQAQYQAHMERFRQSSGQPRSTPLPGQFRTVSPQNLPACRSTQYAMQHALLRPSHGYSSTLDGRSSPIVTVTTTPFQETNTVASKPAVMPSPIVASPMASPLGARNAIVPTPDVPQPYTSDLNAVSTSQPVSL